MVGEGNKWHSTRGMRQQEGRPQGRINRLLHTHSPSSSSATAGRAPLNIIVPSGPESLGHSGRGRAGKCSSQSACVCTHPAALVEVKPMRDRQKMRRRTMKTPNHKARARTCLMDWRHTSGALPLLPGCSTPLKYPVAESLAVANLATATSCLAKISFLCIRFNVQVSRRRAADKGKGGERPGITHRGRARLVWRQSIRQVRALALWFGVFIVLLLPITHRLHLH